jgi:hypothetical protein
MLMRLVVWFIFFTFMGVIFFTYSLKFIHSPGSYKFDEDSTLFTRDCSFLGDSSIEICYYRYHCATFDFSNNTLDLVELNSEVNRSSVDVLY